MLFLQKKQRAWFYQALLIVVLVLIGWWLVHNTLHNLASRHISTGFGFLHEEAGFDIGESPIDYSPTQTYARAVWVGLLNTLKVSGLGIVLASILGLTVGLLRLSPFMLFSKVSLVFVEVIRNIPLIIQLFFWYALITENLPGPRQALSLGHWVFLSNRGLMLPSFSNGSWQLPVLQGFNFQGGWMLSPELTALLLGLVVYTSAFIAEIVRAGIQSVSCHQWDAAKALGLKRRSILRYVVLPQAVRVIIPPLTSTYLNLLKNSSLAVAIGYPDLVSVVNTTINQTGQAIEGILIIMAAYLSVSIVISVLMNFYNKRIQFKGR